MKHAARIVKGGVSEFDRVRVNQSSAINQIYIKQATCCVCVKLARYT